MTTIPDKQPLAPLDVKLPEVIAQLDDEPAAAEPIPDDAASAPTVEYDWYEP
jgi:hypothetical protein